MELVILIGLQASGKSTFAAERFAATHVHVSKDRLRNNAKPERRQRELVAEALAAGRSVVVDNTNPAAEDRAPLIALGREYGAGVVGYYFTSPVKGCLERNARREGRARVPDVAIFATRKRLAPPRYAEGFDALYAVRITDEGDGADEGKGGERFVVSDWREEGREMDNDECEKRMRALEYFHGLRALPGAWMVIRVDGRGFSRFTKALNIH